MKSKKFFVLAAAVMLMATGCQNKAPAAGDVTSANESETVNTSTEITAVTEPPAPEVEYSNSDIMAINWFIEDMTDSETFTDVTDYQYYARTLGLEKDYFLNPEMWEVFYSNDININKDIDDKEYYLIRLNPYKLLDVFAENNNTDIEKLCDRLSVTPAQLYYNWGYNPVSVDYGSKHEKNTATYSEDEQKIFGSYNGEDRNIVMSTHLLMVDNAEGVCTYQSTVTSSLSIKRRDKLQAFTEITPLYSAYTEEEKSPALTVNGIGIRAVIPVTIPNAWSDSADFDKDITAMINVSPYSYGCTDEDIIDIMPYINKQAENKK
ncbi:MAG: hypothetical protein NC253_00800 [Ruminococcus sp.]|nr:hypothetical protein [Ruminococcus sp.]MCM1380970.1 hypothetical protein [Muribaculaceae bacterium]MCM1479475.1 hypothetical protein [Muribaculaceae bacterium]